MSSLDMVSLAAGAAPGVIAAGAALVSAKRWRHTACVDTLTGIANRRGLPRLAKTVRRAAKRGRPAGVAVFDVRRFKRLNDTLGHDVGDRALAELAHRLTTAPVVAGCVRLGGDEFAAVVTPGADSSWPQVANALVEQLKQRIDGVEVAVSLGLAVALGKANQLSRLLAAADTAMYAARRRGEAFGIILGGLDSAPRPRTRARDDHHRTVTKAVTA